MTDLFGFLILASIVALVLALINPRIFSRIFKARASRASLSLIFGGSLFLFFVLFGLVSGPSTRENERPIRPSESKKTEAVIPKSPIAPAVSYRVVKIEDTSFMHSKRTAYSVVVSPTIMEAQVRPTIERVVSDMTAKDSDVDEIMVFVYSDEELAKGGNPYDVGRGIWAPGGEWGSVNKDIARSNDRSGYKLSVDIREDLEDYLKQRGHKEEKFGLSEDKRREIFREIVLAEAKARKEADRLYPVDASDPNVEEALDRNISKMRELEKKYKAEVRAKYGISEEVEFEIAVEGIEENWPMP